VTHEYPAGIYTATLVVSDGSLTDFATTSIVASAVGVNHDPTLADDVAVTAVNTPVNVLVLSNDFDQDGQVVTVSGATTPSHGSVTCSTDGDCLYVPDLHYTGPDAFDYTASDGVGGSATASVSVTVTPGADDNAPPIAADDDLTVVVNKAAPVYVLGNDSDADGDSLSITLKTQTANGDVSCVSFGYCTYTPAADYVGPDTFEYTVADGRGGTDVATVNVTVEANHDPVAVDDVLTTRENAPDPRSVNPIANDSDPDGDPLTLVSNTDPAHGTVDCPSICLYMPAADYVGPDTFDYVVSDGAGGTDSATVNVIVTANHLPVAVDDTAQTVKTKPVAIPILTNDFDEDLDSLAVTDNTQPSHGTVDCSPVIFCDYTPDPAYVGSDGFDYTLSDGTHTSVGHVTISVEPPCFPARCIDNGTILLAVNPAGHLNSDDGIGSAAGAGSVGLDFLATNNDATAPGCLWYHWLRQCLDRRHPEHRGRELHCHELDRRLGRDHR
jgi:hypothetical protein